MARSSASPPSSRNSRSEYPGSRPAQKIILTSLLLLVTLTTQADYQSGLNAYTHGDYRLAMSEWKAVAAQPASEVNPAIYAETHYAIAKLYWQGEGVSRDYYKAHDWLVKAAALDHAGAMGKLGYLYTDGVTVDQDFATAYQWFSKAARLGDVDALYNLGIFYLNGWGVERDPTMAKQYLAAASAQGDREAERALQQLMATEDPIQPPSSRNSHSEYPGSPADVAQEIPHQVRDDEELMPGDEELMPADDQSTQILGEDWILGQSPQHYTIQAIALSNLEKLENLLEGHENKTPFAIYIVQNSGRPLYVLVQGVYPTVEEARAARDSFPATINPPENVWIRRFEKIQEIIAREGES